MSDEDAEICGETWDHDVTTVTEDGQTTYTCSECGAEWWEEEKEA